MAGIPIVIQVKSPGSHREVFLLEAMAWRKN